MSKDFRRRNQIEGQFAPRLIEMLKSPAFRVLSRAARQVLARIEIELADHGGMDNGTLPVTFDDFVAYGVNRHAIAPAIRELEALGLIEVTEPGRAGNAEWRRPTLFRLTYRHVHRAPPTHEWRRITEDDAEMTAKGARQPRSNSARPRRGKPGPEKQNPSDGKRTIGQCGKRTTNPDFHSAETITTVHSAETITTIDSIGEVDGGSGAVSLPQAEGRSVAPWTMREYTGVGIGRYEVSTDPAALKQYSCVSSRVRFPLIRLVA
jgi:hypothetical protein